MCISLYYYYQLTTLEVLVVCTLQHDGAFNVVLTRLQLVNIGHNKGHKCLALGLLSILETFFLFRRASSTS